MHLALLKMYSTVKRNFKYIIKHSQGYYEASSTISYGGFYWSHKHWILNLYFIHFVINKRIQKNIN